MRDIPVLTTERLLIRPYELIDLHDAWALADEAFGDGSRVNDPNAIEGFRDFLTWMTLNPRMLAQLDQPPYGDRAVILRETGALVGQVGYVPYADRFSAIPGLSSEDYALPEVGLFWAFRSAHRGQGFATEAASALIDYAFQPKSAWAGLRRLIATTEFDNVASQTVMRKVGMTLLRNDTGKPAWLQVVGVIHRESAGR
jgi:[ribosomal protein S5]-alanine N-acetyltransferase